ncbi:MAG: prepilin-type N-terminal cleavage/methylation domain-containing protein [Sphingomonadales bacterium]
MVNRTRGFTLVEVLVAFAILSISLVAIYKGFSVGTTGAHKAGQRQIAVSLAQSQLARVGVEIPLAVEDSAGRFANGFHWQIEMAPFKEGPDTRFLTPFTVTLRVFDVDGQIQLIALRTMRLKAPQ